MDWLSLWKPISLLPSPLKKSYYIIKPVFSYPIFVKLFWEDPIMDFSFISVKFSFLKYPVIPVYWASLGFSSDRKSFAKFTQGPKHDTGVSQGETGSQPLEVWYKTNTNVLQEFHLMVGLKTFVNPDTKQSGSALSP